MRRPFLRSLTLWLGLMGFIFLIWAWTDGSGHASAVFLDGLGRDSGLGIDRGGCVFLTRETNLGLRRWNWDFERSKDSHLYHMKGDVYHIPPPVRGLWMVPWAILGEGMEDVPGRSPQFLAIRPGFSRQLSAGNRVTMTARAPFPMLLGIYSAIWAGSIAWRMRKRSMIGGPRN